MCILGFDHVMFDVSYMWILIEVGALCTGDHYLFEVDFIFIAVMDDDKKNVPRKVWSLYPFIEFCWVFNWCLIMGF